MLTLLFTLLTACGVPEEPLDRCVLYHELACECGSLVRADATKSACDYKSSDNYEGYCRILIDNDPDYWSTESVECFLKEREKTCDEGAAGETTANEACG